MPLSIHTLGLKLYDPDDLGVAATMSLVVNEGTITVVAGNSGVAIVSGNGSVSVSLSGTVTQLANLLDDTSTGTISYSSAVAATKTFTITVTDATGQVGTLVFSIVVQAAPPPVVTYAGGTLQADTTGTVGVALNIHGDSRFSITDADAGESLITVTLTMDAGTSTVTSGNSGVAIVSGNSTNSVVISGTVDNLNDLLDGTSNGTITWTGDLVGTRTFTVTAEDEDGGTDDANATIVVGAVPVVVAPSAEIVATEDINTDIHGLGWDVTDADASGTATCVISTTVGTITVAAGDSGITISSGNGTASVTITGTIAQISNLLTDGGTGTITTTHTDPAIGTETVTVTDATSRSGSASQTVRFNADTTKWLGYVSGTLRPATSTIANFITGIDLSRFPTAWWDVVSDNGRDIRVTLTDNVPIPRDLLLFNKTAKTGFLITRFTYSTSPPEIRVHAGALGATAPAAGDANGQYAVYPSHVRGYWPDGAGQDRTQYLNHFTAFGSYTAGNVSGLSGTLATSLSGLQYGTTDVDVPVFDSIFMGAFVYPTSITGVRTVLERTGSAPQADRYRLYIGNSVSAARLANKLDSDPTMLSATAIALGTITTGSWSFLTSININSAVVTTRNGGNSGGASTSGVIFVDAAPRRIVVGADRVNATDTIFGNLFVGNIGLAFFMTGAGMPTNNVEAQNYAFAHYATYGNQPFWWGDWTFAAENLGGL